MPHAKELKAVSRSDTNGIIDPYDPDNVQINPGSYGEDSTDYGSLELPEASYSENLEGETMSKRLKLFKTCSMMLIYAGMVGTTDKNLCRCPGKFFEILTNRLALFINLKSDILKIITSLALNHISITSASHGGSVV